MKKYKKLLSQYNEVVKAKKEEKEESDWRDTEFTSDEEDLLYEKHLLMECMTRWVKHYNQIDGFVPDWLNICQTKHGISICDKKACRGWCDSFNNFVFGLSVSSEERAEQMLKEFGERIEKYY